MSDKTPQNPSYFYNKANFPALTVLEENFKVIQKELLDLLALNQENQWLQTFPDYVTSDRLKAWKVFTFLFFQMKSPKHAQLCPKTAELIYSIPDIISCDFSFLEPNTHILPHKGYTKMVLRCHLPLIVPEGEKCAIRVGEETHFWKEGELVIFDDSFEHEAWNKSDEKRVVLMFDIPNPNWKYSAEEIESIKIENMDDPFLLSIVPKEQWLKAYQARQLPLEEFS
jgi:beta-hydroxylase